jgi:acetyltransferase-like isoleucine patch superfamily enzyme
MVQLVAGMSAARRTSAGPPGRSRRRQGIAMRLARVRTELVYRWLLAACGRGNILASPDFVTWEYLALGSHCRIGRQARIEGIDRHAGVDYRPRIVLGDEVSIEQRCTIIAAATLAIGSRTTISYDVTVTDVDHEYQALGTHVLRQPLRVTTTAIGENCFIGAGARLLAGTVLGDQCVVGANSVVRGRFPDRTVIAGCPARVVRRFDPGTHEWRKTDPTGAWRP